MELSPLLNKEAVGDIIQPKMAYCYSHVLKEILEEYPQYIGIGILYFGIGYTLRAKTAVCLGSGDGFVPNLMRLAQKELSIDGSRTILVDANKPEVGYGQPEWMKQENDFLLDDIETVLMTTADAAVDYFPNQPAIDYLHIDADHSYKGCLADYMHYKNLMAPDGVISIHDTQPDRGLNIELGGPEVIKYIRENCLDYDVLDFPFQGAGTAFIKRIEV